MARAPAGRRRVVLSAQISQLISELQPFAKQLILVCSQYGLMPQVTSTRRSLREQTFLYTRYIEGKSQYPAAKPGTSAHEFGYAFDMTIQPLAALPDVGRLWESWGGVWGGHYSDPIHFEFPGFQAPEAAGEDGFWGNVYNAADWASFVTTPLAVEKGTAAGNPISRYIDQLFGY